MIGYYLAVYPDIKEKIQIEIDSTFSQGEEFTIEKLATLKYTDAFFNEILRIAPPVPGIFFREAIEDHELLGIKIKKGTLVTTSLPMIHNNPKNFEDPEKFNPDRWL